MTAKDLLNYCLEKDRAYLDFPFSEDYPVVKVSSLSSNKARIFAEFYVLGGREIMTFSTDADTAMALREEYPDVIVKGWHCPPVQAKYKSTVYISDMTDNLLKSFVDMSYKRAVEIVK